MHSSVNNVSIIIPTFNEASNIPHLVDRISKLNFNEKKFEVIIVDDNSQDGTKEIISQLVTHYSWLNFICRKGSKSLSDAVFEGIQKAVYNYCIIMDADLSHPPEKIPEMLTLLDNQIDLVIGSRYVKGGSNATDWSFLRKIISKTATIITRATIAIPVHDPLSGFLAFRKKIFYSGVPLKPLSWKIGLEIMVKRDCKNIYEIPIHFSDRLQGESKLTFKILLKCVWHIQQLFWFKLKNRLKKLIFS